MSEVNNPTNNEMLLHSFHHFAALDKVEAIIMPRAIGRAVYLCVRIHYFLHQRSISELSSDSSRGGINWTYLHTLPFILTAVSLAVPGPNDKTFTWKLSLKCSSLRRLGRLFFGLTSNILKQGNYVSSAPASTKKTLHHGALLAFLPILRRVFRTNPLAESIIWGGKLHRIRVLKL